MAEAALFGIAKSVLQQLASPALDEFRLLWGHKKQLEKLEDTINTVRDVLEDADRKQATDATVRGWLARLKAVLYDADDLFDAISGKILLEKNKKGTKIGKKVRRFISKPYRFAFLVKNAHKVEEIRERFDDIAHDIQRFNFLPNQTDLASMSRIGRESTHSFIPRNEVIGREQETEDLVRMLLPDCSQQQTGVSVIAVIGIVGLGKTTLAQLVYNDVRVKQGFDLCMWACINYFSSLQQVLMTLLKSPKSRDIDDLQSSFRDEIKGKQFLLVLDDVWDEDPRNWLQLKHLLSSGKDGSKILTTTRSKIVAQSLCAVKPYFDLKGMSDESAWLLFKKVAFGGEDDQNSSEFEQLGRQIVRKCANVPLAIVTIASLLREKKKEKWFPLINDQLSRAVEPEEYKKITQVLELSYKELPYPIKRCFGYCSLFPKDYEFNKIELVPLWIAQGFVEPLVNQSLEDRGEDYLFYMVNRCFFQICNNSIVITYKMHDLMHDLAMAVAGSESVLVDETEHSSWDKKIRHLSIESESMVDRVCSFSHLKNLRTFKHPKHISLNKIDLKKLISSFRSLRVLDLHRLEIEKLPTSIGELIHLRFLDLSNNDIEMLPSSICSLPHLQSLILRNCRDLKELPKGLENLLSLRHLLLQGCDRCMVLPPISLLPSLKKLDISDMSSMVAIEDIMFYESESFFPSLETLWIENMPKLTSWWLQASTMQPAFPRVTDVNIVSCPKLTRYMPVFPLVEDLRLEDVPEEIIWPALGSEATYSASHGSNVLKKLKIRKIEDLSSIAKDQIRHLSALHELRIWNCKQLKLMSWNGFACLTSLEHLDISNCEEFNWDYQEAEVGRIHLLRVRHLEIPTVNRNLFRDLKHMASLETFIIKKSLNPELQEEEAEEELSWKHLQKLHRLELVFGETFSMRSNQCLLHGFQDLTSLKELTLSECKELYLSWRVLLHLPHLQTVTISEVEQVIDVDSDPMMMQSQPIRGSIRDLTIFGGSREWVNDIPWKFFPSLKSLELWSVRNLEALPEGIQHLAALESFFIWDINYMVSLSHSMSSLSSLKKLVIRNSSSELKKRCERLKGEDWPNIQHIPLIIIE